MLSFYNPSPPSPQPTTKTQTNTHGPGSTKGDNRPTPGRTELGLWGHSIESAQRSGSEQGLGASEPGTNRLQEGMEGPWEHPEAEIGLTGGLAWQGSGWGQTLCPTAARGAITDPRLPQSHNSKDEWHKHDSPLGFLEIELMVSVKQNPTKKEKQENVSKAIRKSGDLFPDIEGVGKGPCVQER